MGKFIVQNLSDRSVKLAIEPWADMEIMEPKAKVLFEHDDYEEPAEIQFAITGDGILVGIMSDLVKITAAAEKKSFETPGRRSPSAPRAQKRQISYARPAGLLRRVASRNDVFLT